jgi:hypothetical protein
VSVELIELTGQYTLQDLLFAMNKRIEQINKGVSTSTQAPRTTFYTQTIEDDGVLDGNGNINGDLNITNNLTVGGTADIAGGVHSGGEVAADGDLSTQGGLSVEQSGVFGGGITSGGNVTASGSGNFGGDITGSQGINVSGEGYIGGDTTIGGTLTVVGAMTGLPIGLVSLWSHPIPPPGYLLADGSAISRDTYSGLLAVIGTAYGSGNGSTTFNVPNAGTVDVES